MNKPFSLYGCIDNFENRMPNNNISINQLINHYNAKKFQQLIEDGQKFVNQNSNSAIAWNLLALEQEEIVPYNYISLHESQAWN